VRHSRAEGHYCWSPPIEEGGGTLRVIAAAGPGDPEHAASCYKYVGFQEVRGFPPPTEHQGRGAHRRADRSRPRATEYLTIQIQIGYEVEAPGRYNRGGVELVYEYECRQHKAVIPQGAICALPTSVAPPTTSRKTSSSRQSGSLRRRATSSPSPNGRDPRPGGHRICPPCLPSGTAISRCRSGGTGDPPATGGAGVVSAI
jgi:hypothetical protein